MISFSGSVRVFLCAGHTDMRKGFDTLALLVQEGMKRDPHAGGRVCSRSVSNAGISSGRPRRRAR